MKIPVPHTTQIERITGDNFFSEVESFAGLLKNVTVTMSEGDPTVTRRRGIENIPSGDASAVPISPSYGRGVAQSLTGTTLYIANDDSIYTDAYGAALGSLGASQSSVRVSFAAIQDATYDMVVIDSENNDGFVLNSGAMVSIAALPAALARGCVYLNGRVFVVEGDTARIYNSDLNAPTTGYTDFVTAEREADYILNIEKHHDHIVGFGTKSIEFFEDQGLSPGSPLVRRRDIYYDIGLRSEDAIGTAGDTTFFIGQDVKGVNALWKLENFQVTKMSDSRFDRYLSHDDQGGTFWVVTPFGYDGRTLVAVTQMGTLAAQNLATPNISFIFEEDGRNYVWDTDGIAQCVDFPLTGYAGFTTTGIGQMGQGDLFIFRRRTDTPDTFKDRLETGVVTEFTCTIEFNSFDGDMTGWKFCHAVEPLGDFEDDTTMSLSWSDEGKAYNTPRVLTKENRQRAISCGRFSRRKFRLTSSDDSDTVDEHLELEGLDADIEAGTY